MHLNGLIPQKQPSTHRDSEATVLVGHHGAEPGLHLQGHVVLLTSGKRESDIGCSLGALGVASVAGGDDVIIALN